MPTIGRLRRAVAVVGVVVTVVVVGLGPVTVAPAGGQAGSGSRAVVVALLPTDPADALRPAPPEGPDLTDTVLRTLAEDGFSVALTSTAQGRYDRRQSLLDMTQGTRVSPALYGSDPPAPALREHAGRWAFEDWTSVARRARDASTTVEPGLLAGSVPGGAWYVGTFGSTQGFAVVAADRTGRLSGVSLGSAATVVQRTGAARDRARLVVVALSPGAAGLDEVGELRRRRNAGDLLIVLHLPPTPPETGIENRPLRFYNQTALGIAGLARPTALTSGSTRQRGLVTAIDVAPTVLDHLGVDVPARMRGQVVEPAGEVDATGLELARRRWSDLRSGRQAASVRAILLGGAVIYLLLGVRGGLRPATGPTLRTLGLAFLWWPPAALLTGALHLTSAAAETWTIAALAIAAALATDRLLPWPAGPVAPAVGGLGLLTADLLAGGPLLSRSVLGPSVISGSRFYGISNEIEPVLPILLLAGLAGLASLATVPGRRQRTERDGSRERLLYAVAGVLLAVVVGASRLGADVGGVVTISVAMTAAYAVLRPGGFRVRTALVALATAAGALVALVLVDLVVGQRGHLVANLTRATGPGELWELVARRYQLAAGILLDPGSAIGVGVGSLAVVWAVRNRQTLFGHVRSPRWRAALVGGLAGGIAGGLSNDSGPVLFVNAVVALAAVTAYLAPPAVGVAGPGGRELPGDEQRAPGTGVGSAPPAAAVAAARADAEARGAASLD